MSVLYVYNSYLCNKKHVFLNWLKKRVRIYIDTYIDQHAQKLYPLVHYTYTYSIFIQLTGHNIPNNINSINIAWIINHLNFCKNRWFSTYWDLQELIIVNGIFIFEIYTHTEKEKTTLATLLHGCFTSPIDKYYYSEVYKMKILAIIYFLLFFKKKSVSKHHHQQQHQQQKDSRRMQCTFKITMTSIHSSIIDD